MTRAPIAVTVAQAAEMVGVSTDTIKRAIHSQKPPNLRAKKVGTKISIAVKDLAAWHESLPDA